MVISSLSVYHIFQILCAIDIYKKRGVFETKNQRIRIVGCKGGTKWGRKRERIERDTNSSVIRVACGSITWAIPVTERGTPWTELTELVGTLSVITFNEILEWEMAFQNKVNYIDTTQQYYTAPLGPFGSNQLPLPNSIWNGGAGRTYTYQYDVLRQTTNVSVIYT